MKVVIHGTNHEQIFNATTTEEARDIAYRATLTVEIHNRDNPNDPWKVYVGEAWPIPASPAPQPEN